ncbi:two-component system regulatory protein YycI [Fictibacillus iocasae]|uniref:Two-component system regulatory protein YycI n=1 Tax=Fictibacillus iocasae TaxID=2715437 RepID=A0ABW2NJU2_9BACL
MDWHKTKTIFILTFLVLNLFLAYQLYLKMDKNNIKTLGEQPLEERLSNNNIKYKGKIPVYRERQTLISGQRYSFTPEERKDFDSKTMTLSESSTDMTLAFTIKKPISLKKDRDEAVSQMEDFLTDNLIRGKEYEFFKYDKEKKQIWFAQKYQEKPIFFDPLNYDKRNELTQNYEGSNGMIKFEYNDKGEVFRFTQTYLSIMRQGDYQDIISPKKALGRLLDMGYLDSGDKITSIRLGYYSLASIEELQVYAPTWSIETEKKHYMVNATDSKVLVLKGEE